MATFPENEVEILRDYFKIAENFDDIKAELTTITNVARDGKPIGTIRNIPVNSLAINTNVSRRRLIAFFARFSLGDFQSSLNSIYSHIKIREFKIALRKVDELAGFDRSSFPEITKETIVNAFNTAPVEFTQFVDIGEGETEPKQRLLKEYTGPKSDTLVSQIVDLWSAIAGDENIFRLRLLRAECLLGQAKSSQAGTNQEDLYNKAIKEYSRLLPSSGETLTTRQKFVLIRSSYAHFSLADFLFRRAFRFNESNREGIIRIYRGVRRRMRASGISPDNELGATIIDYAKQQQAKIESGFNFLGYRDSYVPEISLKTLRDFASSRISAAIAAADRFESFKTRADALAQELSEMEQQELEQELGLGIASQRVANAILRKEIAGTQVQRLADKAGFLKLELAAGIAQSIFTTITKGVAGAPTEIETTTETTINGPGLIGAAVGYFASQNELAHQQKIAEIEQRIAIRDESIALLEQRLVQSRLDFIQATIQAKKDGNFNADRFFTLANAAEDMARQQVEAAFVFLYLYERAISFRRLKPLRLVESGVTNQDILISPSVLNVKLNDLNVEAESTGTGQTSFPLPKWSLRTQYPIEFSQFLQTGQMVFFISLYDVEKRMGLKGRSNIRIKKVTVDVVGLIPSSGFVGELIHSGTMIFRDKEATLALDPDQSRFVPTEEEVQQALLDLESGRRDRAQIGGVELISLNEDSLTISSEGGDNPSDPDFDLAPLENYGLTGIWMLSIDDLDLRAVTDINLRFSLSFEEFDSSLEEQVKRLLRNYERELSNGDGLDEITAFSMRSRFLDAFRQLQNGESTIRLKEDDFPSDKKDLKVKAVILLATDEEKKGVESLAFEIGREDIPFSLARATNTQGFTEDVNGEIPVTPKDERFSVFGDWNIRLTNPDQFSRVNDVIWFFLYEYKELDENS